MWPGHNWTMSNSNLFLLVSHSESLFVVCVLVHVSSGTRQNCVNKMYLLIMRYWKYVAVPYKNIT